MSDEKRTTIEKRGGQQKHPASKVAPPLAKTPMTQAKVPTSQTNSNANSTKNG